MSQRANPFAVGIFFAVAVSLFVAALFFFGAQNIFRKSERFVVYFEGSITGLKVGAPVTFQGVQIGQVSDIRLNMSGNNGDIVIPVLIDIDRNKFTDFVDNNNGVRDSMINRGLRAQLKLQSVLTSLLFIELDFYPGTPLRLLGTTTGNTELPSIPTPLQELMRNVDQMNINELIQTSRQTIIGIEKLVNSPDTQGSVTALRQLLEHADEAVVHFDQETVPAVQELRKTLSQVALVSADIHKSYPALAAELEQALKETHQAVNRFDKVMSEAQFLLSEDSALYQELQKAAKDVSSASRSVQEMSDSINNNPESLLLGKPDNTQEK
jgi:paraquat-inducible protein B